MRLTVSFPREVCNYAKCNCWLPCLMAFPSSALLRKTWTLSDNSCVKQSVSPLGKHLSASMYSQKFSEQEDSQGGGIRKREIDACRPESRLARRFCQQPTVIIFWNSVKVWQRFTNSNVFRTGQVKYICVITATSTIKTVTGLLYARYYFRQYTIYLFNPHTNAMREIPWFSTFYR